MLAQALEAEIELFINQYADLRDELGRQRIVRNGYLPQREIQSGVGAVTVKAPRVRDRHTNPSEKIHFNSSILPPYLRKTKSIEELIPWLYLKLQGIGGHRGRLPRKRIIPDPVVAGP